MRTNNRRSTWWIIVTLSSLMGGATQAAIVDGRLTSSAYAYEANPTDSTHNTHVRSYAALRLKVTDLGDRRLSLVTYLRATTDLSERAVDDPAFRPVSAYVRFKDRSVDVRIGRQIVQAGVGFGQTDGVRLDLRTAGFHLLLHGGALVPVYGEVGIGSLSEAHLFGLKLSTSRFAGIDMAVSFADRERDPIRYRNEGLYSGFVGQPEAVRRQLVGMIVRRLVGAHRLEGRLDWDLQRERLRRAQISSRIALNQRLAVSIGWMRREPALVAGSIFSVFAAEGFDEVTLWAHYQVRPGLTLAAHGAHVTYDTDDSQRLGVSATLGRHLTVGYNRSQGYAGANDGFNGSVHYAVSPKWVLRGQLGLASFERVADDRQGLLSGVAALTYRANRRWSLDTQLQALRNPAYDTDVRLLLRGTWRFRS